MAEATLLIELGCEEIPANACRVAEADAARVVERLLAERRLPATGGVRALVSPRRIAVLAAGVAAAQAAERVEHRGPPEAVARDGDGWSRAAAGFARRHGLEPDALALRDGFAWAVVDQAAQGVGALAQELVDGLVAGLEMPKNMRWGTEAVRFTRPIRTLVVLHGADVLLAQVAGVASGRATRGHRLVAPAVEIPAADGYVDAMRAAGVVVDQDERRREIAEQLDAAAAAAGAAWSDPGGVLAEVAYLVERPHAVAGEIDVRFRDLPDRVLVTAMQSHQRYLPLTRGGARVGFLTVANSDPAVDATVRAGNEQVLRGRLEDAEFSLGRDVERGLDALRADLDRITYHARAGSIGQRVERLEALVAPLAERAGASDEERAHALAAAAAAKDDLASVLVGEFAELQGYVGMEYARRAGLPEPVALAIGEQYLPDGAAAEPPATLPGALVALADKLDALVSILAVGERPTGSRDPFALRRAASGAFEILRGRGIRVDLAELALGVHAQLVAQGARVALDGPETAAAVRAFVLDRADTWLEGQGVEIDLVRCARGRAERSGDPVAHVAHVRALEAAVGGDDLARVLAAWTRCHRLARRSADEAAAALDRAALADPSEVALADALAAAGGPVDAALAADDVPGALAAAAAVAGPVDAFFDAVMVMADDPRVRGNRLRLLVDVTELMERFGDLAQVQR